MKLSKAQQAIYNLLKERGEATIVEMREALKQSKPDMRISEINHAYKAEHGTDLIVTLRKKPNGEHIKGLARPLTKKQQCVEIRDGVAFVSYKEVAV